MYKYNDKIIELRKKTGFSLKAFSKAIGIRTITMSKIEDREIEANEETYNMIKNFSKKMPRKEPKTYDSIIITSAIYKGGAGKSTTTINVAVELARRGFEVLLIDADSQMDMSYNILKTDIDAEKKNFFKALTRLDDFYDDGYIITSMYENIDIIPASISGIKIEKELSMIPKSEKAFSICLNKLLEKNCYDFILVDCNNQLGLLADSLWMASDFIMTVCEPSFFNLKGAGVIMDQIRFIKKLNTKLNHLGILFNKVHRSKEVTKLSFDEIDLSYPGSRFLCYVSQDENINKAQWAGTPLYYFDKKTRAIKDYQNVTTELLQRIDTYNMKGDE